LTASGWLSPRPSQFAFQQIEIAKLVALAERCMIGDIVRQF